MSQLALPFIVKNRLIGQLRSAISGLAFIRLGREDWVAVAMGNLFSAREERGANGFLTQYLSLTFTEKLTVTRVFWSS